MAMKFDFICVLIIRYETQVFQLTGVGVK